MYYDFIPQDILQSPVVKKGALKIHYNENFTTPYCVVYYNGSFWQQVSPWRVYLGVAIRDKKKLLLAQQQQ